MTETSTAYQDALASVEQTLGRLRGCTEDEKSRLRNELAGLRAMHDKLTSGRVEIVIFGEISTQIPQDYIDLGYLNDVDLIIELGDDYVNSPAYMEDPFYSLPSAPTPATTTESTGETTENANPNQ